MVGFMSARSPAEATSDLAAFRHGLGQTGFFGGKNVTIEYHWAEGHYDRLPAMATELVARQVAVIAVVGGEPSGLAAKAATTTIPIVCSLGGDAVKAGLVTQLNRPGGNITGVSILGSEMGPKRLELAHQLVPNASTLAVLINSKFPRGWAEARDMEAAAHSLSVYRSLYWTPAVKMKSTGPSQCWPSIPNHEAEQVNSIEYLRRIYRDPNQPISVRMRAAIESLPYENPKLTAVAVGYLKGEDFYTRLDRAVEASERAKLIEAKAIRTEKN